MFETQYVSPILSNTPANTLFDNSSSASLVTHEYASQQGFQGEPVSYWLVSTGYAPQLRKTTLYRFKLMDNEGVDHEISALGIDVITSFTDKINLSAVMHLFPHAPSEVWDRPSGTVDLLLGLDHRDLQPAGGLARDGCAVGGLRLSES